MNRKLQIILVLLLLTVNYGFSQVKAYKPSTYYLCSENGSDAIFDLTSKLPEILKEQDASCLDVKFYYTKEDAEEKVNHIVVVKEFKIDASCTEVYVRVTNEQTKAYDTTTLKLCFSSPINLEGKTPPIINCPDTEVFDLTRNEPLIFEGLDASLYTVTYHLTESAAVNDHGAIVEPNKYLSNTYTPAELFVRVENNNPEYDGLDNDCFSTAYFLIDYDDLLGEDDVFVIEACDYNGDDKVKFDLTEREEDIIKGKNGIELTYYISGNDAKSETNPLISKELYNHTNPQLVFVVVKNSNTGCKSITKLKLVVLEGPNVPDEVTIENEGLKEDPKYSWFVLDAAIDEITANDKNVSISYYSSWDDANKGINASGSNMVKNSKPCKGEVYARVNKSSGCFKVVKIHLVVKDCNLSISNEEKLSFTIYPNPVSTTLKINSNQFQKAAVRLVNVKGQLLFENEIDFVNNHAQLNVSNLPKGLYFISLTNKEKSTYKKLVIE